MSESEQKSNGYSRRSFLKIVGATTGVAAVGCGQKPIEKLIPYVIQPDEVIPGLALWYSGSCNECSAGCGVLVRTREGRATKLEGNPYHPINRGGLCAHGQSAVQAHYDPDRIREPLKREANGAFKVAAWPDAVKDVADALTALGADEQALLLTGEVSGSLAKLIAEFTKAFPKVTHQTFELFSRETIDRAAELCFGAGVQPRYKLNNAEVIVNFGADFLETWVSPVEFSRDWAERRRPNKDGEVSYSVHFEPRLSMTAANADRWVKNKPGSEASLMLALLKLVFDETSGGKLSGGTKAAVGKLVSGVDVAESARSAGVELKVLQVVAKRLAKARPSLVLAGGASTSGANNLNCAVLANIFNALLGNLGSTLYLAKKDGPALGELSSHQLLLGKLSEIASGTSKTKLLIFSGTNPAYLLPQQAGFEKALAKVATVVAVSGHLDETTLQANIVLPKSSSLESWGDSEPVAGLFNLNQPAMQPLYQTQSLGDTLISIAGKAGTKFKEATSFLEYVQACWKERVGAVGFDSRWLEFVERGGDFENYKLLHVPAELKESSLALEIKTATIDGAAVLAYPTVLSADGSTANRSWMQEVPNPMSSTVWGSFVEMHPEMAAKYNVAMKDVVQLRTETHVIELPVFITRHIHPELVAVPIGQGHVGYGRYAAGVGVNALSLLGGSAVGGVLALLAAKTSIEKSISGEELAIIQWQNEQLGRGILRSMDQADYQKKVAHAHDDHGHDKHHNLAKAHDFTDLEHRPQMYKQMDHPKYRWGMSVDLATCTGCSACVVACYAENNIAVTGKEIVLRGRVMSWIKLDRYFDGPEHRPLTGFQPMMCQHCGNAPCEPVCPVYATYHNEEGLNSMVYNRCVGTRYCSNNCSYKVRRFNWFKINWPEPLTWQLNPDVTVREVGIMEKCTFCVQRIKEVQNRAKSLGRDVLDGEVQPACASSCPTKAITFGNLLDKTAEVSKLHEDPRAYKVLDAVINTQPAISYLTRVVHSDEV